MFVALAYLNLLNPIGLRLEEYLICSFFPRFLQQLQDNLPFDEWDPSMLWRSTIYQSPLIQRVSYGMIIKGSLEEILPSYEKLRNVCVHVRAREGK